MQGITLEIKKCCRDQAVVQKQFLGETIRPSAFKTFMALSTFFLQGWQIRYDFPIFIYL